MLRFEILGWRAMLYPNIRETKFCWRSGVGYKVRTEYVVSHSSDVSLVDVEPNEGHVRNS
jgi:hypothetical protein